MRSKRVPPRDRERVIHALVHHTSSAEKGVGLLQLRQVICAIKRRPLRVPPERGAGEPVDEDECGARRVPCGLGPDRGAVGRGEHARALGGDVAVGHGSGGFLDG